ncbi:MAG: cell division protein FtsX, partial [Candidatus Limnocylindrus sp.]
MSRAQNGRLIRLSVSAAVNGLSRNRLATVAATMTMTLMLLVLASVLVIRAGLDAALSYADSKVEVVAYLKVGASEERANSLRNEILKIDGVKEATYVTADEALAAFRERLKERGEPDLTGELDENPLPASFEIALNSPSETAKVADALSSLPSAALFSRINTYLSAPMLFGMLAATHYGGVNLVTAIVAIALGAAVI